MLHKSCPVKVKAIGPADGLDEGIFEAIVSVFGNEDSYGDVVVPGAFTDTLKDWAVKGDPIPVYYSHRMDDPDYNIGYVLEAKETDQGLWVKAQIDLDDEARKARQVYRLLKGRRVTQFSFAYDIVEAGWVTEDEDEHYELRKLKLHEVGPTPIGANQETELIAVKAAGEHAAHMAQAFKTGRVLSSKNETTLRTARDQLTAAVGQLDDVLSALDSGADDQEKANGRTEAKSDASDEEPDGAKSSVSDEEPKSSPSVDIWATHLSLLALGNE